MMMFWPVRVAFVELVGDFMKPALPILPMCSFTMRGLRNVWFQHDGAPAHKTSSVKQYLVEEFGEQIIGYGGFQEWPPRSPDLTPMGVFLWGYLKQQVYEKPSPNIAGSSMTHYGYLCQCDTCYATPCAT
ncbi:hypothetical protein AVEN_14212-1 [Araneus ventricosus]|uniref:Tc1-like transposase DDE domain-containing protein n=1 Tax=Araneus ventricosus TaxID=182803 RepID=A0A4Y2SP54_ARAVE|nr:hypothetical protein AVEN_270176-1 [Araneus ventricosus]GBN89498.1 hypothetical protein AVEN_14212-1 [Araneus ventricosus]